MRQGERTSDPSSVAPAEPAVAPGSAGLPGLGSDGRALAGALRRLDPGIAAAVVARLQRASGNAAVASAVGPPLGERLLQRAEHAEGEFGARPNMVPGDTGPGVSLLQRLLGVKQTGVFDSATRAAVDRFQRQMGWEPSGVGPMTWDRLERHEGAMGARPNLVMGDRGPGVKLLQKYLGVAQTSVFDQATRTAVDAFQRSQGWEPGGVGPMTWERLDARTLPTTLFELADEGDSTIVVEGETDPRRKASYIDNRVEAVGWGLYVGTLSGEPGSFLVYCRGLSDPILLPWRLTRFESDPRTPIGKDGHGDAVYASREEAMQAARDPEREVAFFPTAGGMFAPTVFTPNTTPRLMAAAKTAFEETVAEVQAELIVVAFSIVAGALGRFALKRLQRAKPPAPKAKPDSKPPAPKPAAPKPDEAPPKSPQPTTEVEEAPPTPRVVASDEVSVSLLKPAPQGPAADYGTQLGTRLKTEGKVAYKALKPIAQDLTAKTDLSPAQKADAAKAAVDVSRPTFGAGPVVEMNGHYVVPSRLTGPASDVMVVKPDGGVVFGNASIREGPNNTWLVKDLRIKP